MITNMFRILSAIYKGLRCHTTALLLLASGSAFADPTGNFRYPINGHSFDGNMLFSVRVDNPDGLGRVVIRFNNDPDSELLVCNCGNNQSESFTDAGIKPRSLNLDIGSHTAQLITNNGANVVDTVSFSWAPPEITGVQVNRVFGSFSISWSLLSGYSRYNLYIASVPDISPENADSLPDSLSFRSLRSTNQTVTGVDDELGLFGLVTGTDESGESAFSQVFRIEALDNQDPIIGVDSFTLNEDSSLSGNVLSNDQDPENQPLTATLVSGPENGSVDLNSDGTFTYDPVLNYNGVDQFTYTANDPQGGSQLGTVTLNISAINDQPEAENDNYEGFEDTIMVIDAETGVLSNDDDIDGDVLTASVVNNPENGSLDLDTAGSFIYAPNAEFFGIDSFTYQVSDGNGGTTTASVSIRIVAINDLPVANDDNYQTNEDERLTVDAQNGVLSNDTDADRNDQLSASLVTGPDNGTLSLSSNGAFEFVPNDNFFGTNSFIYQTTDASGATSSASVTIAVAAVNDNPVAIDDIYSLDEDSVLTVSAASGLLANDSDIEDSNTQLTASLVTGPENGTMSINSQGGFTYTPNADYFGTDSITYRVTDSQSGSATAQATFNVAAVNEPPIANDDIYQVNEDETLAVIDPGAGLLANDTDPDIRDADKFTQLTVTLLNGPGSGNLNLESNGTFTYSPALNFFGTITFSYQIADPEGQTATANVTIEVADVPDVPLTQADNYSVDEDSLLTVTVADGVLANDVDPAGGTLEASVLTQPQSGGLSLSSDGSFNYQPNQDFNGNDSFVYQVQNALGLTAQETVTINVAPVNDAPVAVNDVLIIDESTSSTISPLANDTDIDGDSLRIINAVAEIGVLTFSETSIAYTAPNDPGNDVISYTVSDPGGLQATATISVTINNVDEAPIATDDTASTNEDTPVTLTPMDNDSDPDGDVLTLSADTANNGTVAVEGDSLTFTPQSNFNGTATVSYFISDPAGNMATGNIVIEVLPVNDAPEAVNDEAFVPERESVTFDPRVNDSDVDGDALTITGATLSEENSSGEVSFTASSLTYTAPSSPGTAVINYTISDPDGATASASVQVTISNVDDTPITQDDIAVVDEDTSVIILPLENDTEPDGEVLRVSVQSATNGTATLASSTSILFNPEENFNGTATIVYLASDPGGNSATGNISITVNAVNDAPVAVDDAVTVAESSTTELTPLANDVDVDGDLLSITEAFAASGSLSVNGSTLTYTAPDVPGEDTINYTISDPSGATSIATINLTISNVQDAPVAVDDFATTNEDTQIQISPLNNDSDEDGDALTVTIDSVSSGSADLNNNVITYTPAANFNGTAIIGYSIADTANNTSSATITITINTVNDAPVAVNDSASTFEDNQVQITPLNNDFDVDGDALTLTVLSVSSGEAFVTGSVITYIPISNFNGTATISYQISDPSGATASATVSVSVIAVNDTPIAIDDSATTAEDTQVEVSPLSNDSDPDNDTLTLSVISVSSGSADVNGDVVIYTPASNFNGTATISYRIGDTSGATATATITVTVTSVNDNPIAVNDSVSTNEDTPVDIRPLDNDSDVDGDALTFEIGTVTNGIASSPAQDTITFTPTENFNGAATIQYTVSDNVGGSASATITINVTAVNDAPVAIADSVTVDEGASVSISPLTNDSDPDGDNLTLTEASVATGTVVVNSDATTLTYTAPTGFAGTTVINYTVTDTQLTATSTVTVTVNDINHPPVAVNDSYSVNAGETSTLNVLSNDTDTDNDTLTITEASATQGTATVSTDALSLSYTAPSNITTTDTVIYTITDPSGATSSATATVTVTEQAFSGDFDTDGDGNTDVTATASGSDYIVSFGSEVGAVYYDDNGSTVAVTSNDSGTFELTIQGTTTPNSPANGIMRDLIDLGADSAPAADHILPATSNEVKFTINGNEYGFSVYDLDQSTANVAFLPPRPLKTGFNANTSFDFFLRYPSFTGPVRLGLDNGEHYVLNTDATGIVQGTDFDFDISWQETNTQLEITILDSVESSQMMSVYQLDDDSSDGIALGIITKAEADAYVSATSTEMVEVFTKEIREVFTFIRDHQLYLDAISERYQSYRIDSNANPTITSANTAVTGALPEETQNVELWDISQLKVNPISFSDVSGGIATYIPRINNNQFEDLVADTCLFTETTPGAGAGSGSCVFASQSFTWSITNNILRIDFGNEIIADYRWLDDLAFENTFSIELAVGTGNTQENYSAYVYWLALANLSDSQVSTFISNNYLDSALTKTNPDARMSDGSINTLNLSGFYFANNGLAKNLDSVTSFFGTEIIDSDRKWNINNSLITIESLSSFSSGGTFAFVYDQCTNSNDANCFIWQFRELFPIAIDGNKLWVWETVLQNQDGFEFKGSVNYQEIIPPRIQFYELNSTIPGAPNSINFNREPVWSKIELVTDENTPLNNVSLSSFFQDPESDTIVLTQVGVDSFAGSVTLNDDQTISYTPATGFIGSTNLYLDATDGVNDIFPAGVITVRSANQTPVANNDSATAVSGFPNLIDPLLNDTDPDNDALIITVADPGTGQGTVNIINGSQLEYTPPNTFAGEATISYTISDGRGSSASATITVTVSRPVFSGSYDLDNSSVPDFTISSNSGSFTVTFGTEVSAVYYTLNGQKFILGKNEDGTFSFDYPANTSPIPVLNYVINGVEYSFAPDDLTQTTPNLVFNGFVALVNELGTQSSYQLIARQPTHSSALATGQENGALYDLQSDGTGQYSSPTISDSVTWNNNSNGDVEVNFTNPQEQQVFYNVYDLDDDMSDGFGLGVITKAEADAYVTANNTNIIDVFVANTAHRLESLGLYGYFYNVLAHETQRFRIDSAAHPQVTSAQNGVVVSFSAQQFELLDTSKFNFLAFSASELTSSSVYLPVPLSVSNRNAANNFETDQCNFTETTTGSNAGTGSCVNSSQTFSWLISTDSALSMTFDTASSTQLSASYRKLNSGSIENTVFVKSSLTTNSVSEVYSTLDYWMTSQTLSSSAITTLLSGSYFETGDNISNPFNYDAQGQLNTGIAKGFYLNSDGLAKDIFATFDVNNNTVYTDIDLRWAVDSNTGNVTISAQTNLLSTDTYRYFYSQCVITNDQNCYSWQRRSWVPLAIAGNRLWVLDSEQTDNDPFDNITSYDVSDTPRIRFYEVRTPVPGVPNSISFNQEPVFSNSANFKTTENTPVTINVLNHIIDPESDTVTVNSGRVSNGILVVNTDSTITYTPNTGFIGGELLTLNVSDGINTADLFTVITVATANNAPVANNDTFVATRGKTNVISPLDNDTDVDNDILLITRAEAANGTAVRSNGDTSIDYTAPNNGVTDTITYDIDDGRGGTASAVISITINDDPIANADNYNTPVDRTLTITPLSNDSDVNGDTINIVEATVDIGTVFIINNGQALSFIAPSSPTTSTINYKIDDGNGGSATSTVTVTVIPNSPPTATSDTDTVSAGGTVTLTPLANDTDNNGDSLTISQASSSDGVVVIAIDSLSLDFTPSITSGTAIVNYTADDGFGGTSSSTISVTVVSSNNAPTDILVNGLSAISVPRNSTGNNFTLGSLTTNDADTGDSHSYSLVTMNASTLGTCTSASGNGSFDISGNSLRSRTSLVPATYEICVQTDDTSTTFQKTLSIIVSNNAPNDITLSNNSINDSATGTNVNVGTLNTADADGGDTHSYALVTMGTSTSGACTADSGNTSFNISGTSLQTANTLTAGTYNICVQSSDGNATFEKDFAITVISTNNAPVAVNDTKTVLPFSPNNTIDVLANDSDPDGDTITVVSATLTSSGSVKPANDNLSLVYTSPSTERTDTITYTIQDSQGAQATATVAVTMNTNPSASTSNEFISTSASKTFTPSVTDTDGDTFTVTAASVTSGNTSGSVDSFSGSSITFNSTAVEGTAVIDYTVQDAYGGTASSTITVNVNAAPTVSNETYTFDSATTVSVSATAGPLANDSDPNSETLSISLATAPTQHSGGFVLNGDGSFSYTHNGGSTLSDSFTYTVSDGTHSITGTASINIVKENFAPELCSAPPAYARVGEAFSHSFTGVDSGSMSLSGSGLTNNPTWLTISQTDSSTFTLAGTPTSSDIGKTSNIQATITDGIDTASITFDITVESEFGTANKAQFNLLTNSPTTALETVHDVVIDNKGRIVVVGDSNNDFLVARFLANGTLDTSFNSTGILSIDFSGGTDSAKAVAIRKDNSIVVAGETTLGNVNWAIAVLNENGSFDSSFNTTGQLLQTDFSGTANDYVSDVIVRDDGRIIVVGSYNDQHTNFQQLYIAARYLSNGSLDSSFNTNGYYIFSGVSSTINLTATTALLDQDGGLFIGGYDNDPSGGGTNNYDMLVINVTDSGLATSWNTTGTFYLDDAGNEKLHHMVFDGNGDLLLAGERDTDMAVYRASITQSGMGYTVTRDNSYSDGDSDDDRFTFNGGGNEAVHRIIPDGFGSYLIVGKDASNNTIAINLSNSGLKDTNFGTSGVLTVPLASPQANLKAVATLLQGQLLFTDPDLINSNTDSIVQLYRVRINSGFDFGNNCGVISDYSTAELRTEDTLAAGVITSDSKVYLVGHSASLGLTPTTPTFSSEDFVVAKVDRNGNLVSDFGDNGTVRIDESAMPTAVAAVDAITMASDSLLIVGRDGTTNNYAHLFLARITAAGELDTSFDSDGFLDITATVRMDQAEAAYISGSNQFLLAGQGENASSNVVYRVYRYNSDGTPDNTGFGMGTNTSSLDNSANYTDFEEVYYTPAGIEVLSNGDIYFVGSILNNSNLTDDEISLIKHNASGLRDSLFGTSGVLTISNGSSYLVKASTNDGTNIFVLAQNTNTQVMAVYKFNLAGEALDTSFGTAGKVTLTNYIANNHPDIEVDSNGKIWLSVKHQTLDLSLVRLNADGSFDGSFINAGQAALSHEIELWTEVVGIELTSGNEAAIFGYNAPTLNTVQRRDFRLAFSNDKGVVSNSNTPISVDFGDGFSADDMALGNEGHLYLAGEGVDTSNYIPSSIIGKYDYTGTPDTSFGTLGQSGMPVRRYDFLSATYSFEDSAFNAISLSNRNDIFASGNLKDAFITESDFFQGKATPSAGTFDVAGTDIWSSGFADIDNVVTSGSMMNSNDNISGQYLADDGSLYLVGSKDNIAIVIKYTSSGLSSTFNSSSKQILLSPQTSNSHLEDITMGADGDLIAVGYTGTGTNTNGLVIKFSTDGALDAGFGSSGVVEFSATSTEEKFTTVSIGPNGNIIASGYSGNDALAVMYTGAGALNTSFDTDGYKTVNFGSSVSAQEVFVDSQSDKSGGIVLLAQVENKFTLIRLDTAGTTLYDSGSQSLGVFNDMQALSIDKLGGVLVAGSAQVDASYNWQLVVVRFPNVVGSF